MIWVFAYIFVGLIFSLIVNQIHRDLDFDESDVIFLIILIWPFYVLYKIPLLIIQLMSYVSQLFYDFLYYLKYKRTK